MQAMDTHECMYTREHTHTFSCLFSWYSLPLSMQMTFIMQMHANQIQPSENQGWERKKKLDTEIEWKNEREKGTRENPFEWQEAVS